MSDVTISAGKLKVQDILDLVTKEMFKPDTEIVFVDANGEEIELAPQPLSYSDEDNNIVVYALLPLLPETASTSDNDDDDEDEI